MRRCCVILAALAAILCGDYDLKNHTANQWKLPVTNYGEFGQTGGSEAGGEWPINSGHYYIFGAGPWIGTLAPNGDTLVSVGYNPNSGGNEYGPGLYRQGTGGHANPFVRVYLYPGDWPPNPDTFPMAPQTPLAVEETWSSYSDVDSALHNPGDTRPIGIDIYQTGYAYTFWLMRDVVFLRFELKNCTTDTMRRTYAGICVDADVGTPQDDVTGLILRKWFPAIGDTVKFVGWTSDRDPPPGWGAVAIMFIKTPGNRGLTAFKRFSLENDPPRDWARYMTLAGYNYQTGQYEPYDSIDTGAGDKRFLMSSGPFDLLPGQKEELVIAVMGADFRVADTTALARCARDARKFWDEIVPVAEQGTASWPGRALLRISHNPVVGRAVITYSLPSSTVLSLRLFDAAGRVVHQFCEGAQVAGNHQVSLPSELAKGVYFLRLATAQEREELKIVVLK